MGQIKSTPAKALAYIARPDATAEGIWVSTNADTIIDPSDFRAVARQFEDTVQKVGVLRPRAGSVLAHHVIQSFDPSDGIDASTAHRIGVQLAEQITGGEHEYMLATHLDKGHVHNHIILNAVNRETGRRFRVQKGTIGRIRSMSDELCRIEGLRVLPPPTRATGLSMAEIYRVLKGDSAKQLLRTEIDKAAMHARDWQDFEAILGRAGIEVGARGGRSGTLSFREISMGRAVRDYRLGAAYTEASIMARLSRQVVNQIGVDASMVTRETRDTITVIVPGTQRKLHLTVSKSQIVRRGRSLRIYIPANDKHRLSNLRGDLARTVNTSGLYQWFSEPDLVGATHHLANRNLVTTDVGRWSGHLNELRQLEARVNAKARWTRAGDGSIADAVTSARAFVAEQHFAYQSLLVATTDVLANSEASKTEIAGLQAQLRIMEREIDGAKADIYSLTKLSKEEVRMSVSDRINAHSIAARTMAEDAEQRKQREQTHRLTSRAAERKKHDLAVDDAAQDRDGGTRSMSLQDRIEAETNKMRTRNQDRSQPRRKSSRKDNPNDGRTR